MGIMQKLLVGFFHCTVLFSAKPLSKIVGLVAVRNEQAFIVPCLKALALYTDEIVVLDDASEDDTLVKIDSVAKECNVKIIIRKQKWYRDEPGDKNLLLKVGREIGGTHFLMLDADEMLTSNCLANNFLRNKILALEPGDKLCLNLINLWRSFEYYRFDNSPWASSLGDFIFCDDGKCFYESRFIHSPRSPANLKGKSYELIADYEWDMSHLRPEEINDIQRFFNVELAGQDELVLLFLKRYIIDQITYEHKTVPQAIQEARWLSLNKEQFWGCYRRDFSMGVMHFQFVNWSNLLIKQAWYRCLEKIRDPNTSSEKINDMYGQSKAEAHLRLRPVPKNWLYGYSFFDASIYFNIESQQKKQVLKWFDQWGIDYFKELDIWDIDWGIEVNAAKVIKRNITKSVSRQTILIKQGGSKVFRIMPVNYEIEPIESVDKKVSLDLKEVVFNKDNHDDSDKISC